MVRSFRRLLAAVLAGSVLVLIPAGPAGADPPAPTDYLSEVLELRPAVPGVQVSVVGGDSFLLLEVEPGHEVAVPGYDANDPEEYLRFLPDGRVQENRASAAYVLNQTRAGTGDPPAPGAPPLWVTVATDGRWAWHDHRIHNMADHVPPAARTADGYHWDLPIEVDGTAVTVAGRYRLLEGPSPLPWLGLVLALVVAVIVATARLSPLAVGGFVVLVAGAAGLASGVAQRSASPPGAPTSPLIVILPAIAAVAGIIAVMQRARILRAVATLAGAAAIGGWSLVRIPVLWRAILPTDLAFGLDRASTAVALGAAVGAAVVVVRSGALAPPPPTSQPSPPPASGPSQA